jgi:hypothetical protein
VEDSFTELSFPEEVTPKLTSQQHVWCFSPGKPTRDLAHKVGFLFFFWLVGWLVGSFAGVRVAGHKGTLGYTKIPDT